MTLDNYLSSRVFFDMYLLIYISIYIISFTVYSATYTVKTSHRWQIIMGRFERYFVHHLSMNRYPISFKQIISRKVQLIQK